MHMTESFKIVTHLTGRHKRLMHMTGRHKTTMHMTGRHKTRMHQTGRHKMGRLEAGGQGSCWVAYPHAGEEVLPVVQQQASLPPTCLTIKSLAH